MAYTKKRRGASLCAGLKRKTCYRKRSKNCRMTKGKVRKSHCHITRRRKA